jgi:hypothetical protein
VGESWSLTGEFELGDAELRKLTALLEPLGYHVREVARDGAPGWGGWWYWIVIDVPDDAPVAAEVRTLLGLPPRP